VKHFDAVWFCYSPVHQVQEYYRYGQVDDCLGHWSKLWACLKQRTKFAEEAVHDPMKGKHPLWSLRSKEEAAGFWEQEFGHVERGEDRTPAPQPPGREIPQEVPSQSEHSAQDKAGSR